MNMQKRQFIVPTTDKTEKVKCYECNDISGLVLGIFNIPRCLKRLLGNYNPDTSSS